MDKTLDRVLTIASIAMAFIVGYTHLKPHVGHSACNTTDGYCFTHDKAI